MTGGSLYLLLTGCEPDDVTVMTCVLDVTAGSIFLGLGVASMAVGTMLLVKGLHMQDDMAVRGAAGWSERGEMRVAMVLRL